MTTPSPSKDKGHARRLLVTLVITTAAAAVTAGVVMKKHQPAEGVQRVELSAAPAGAIAAPAAPAVHRVEWRDPWKRPAARTESAPTSISNVPYDGPSRSDPSLPSAAGVLEHAFGVTDQPATF